MAAPKKYPDELRERATRMAVEARRDPATRAGALARIGKQLGINPETLQNWVTQAEIDGGVRPAPRPTTLSESPSWNGRTGSCAGPTRF
jgi:transposase